MRQGLPEELTPLRAPGGTGEWREANGGLTAGCVKINEHIWLHPTEEAHCSRSIKT